MHRTSAIAASLLLAVPFAAFAAGPAHVAEAPGDDLRDDAPGPRPELTFSGNVQHMGWYHAVPGLTIAALAEGRVFEISGGYIPPGATGIYEVAASILGGWNARVVGAQSPRQGVQLDLRLLGGATLSMQKGSWLSLPLLGLAGAAEVASTVWLSHDIGLTVAAMGGLNLTYLIMPAPMARFTAGLTF